METVDGVLEGTVLGFLVVVVEFEAG